MYKIAAPDGWMVILCGRALAEELRSLPDSVMSFSALANQVCLNKKTRICLFTRCSARQFLQTEFMVSRRAAEDTYHTDLVRTVLPKKLDSIFPEVQDEIAIAFAELLSSAKDGEQNDCIYHNASHVPLAQYGLRFLHTAWRKM